MNKKRFKKCVESFGVNRCEISETVVGLKEVKKKSSSGWCIEEVNCFCGAGCGENEDEEGDPR